MFWLESWKLDLFAEVKTGYCWLAASAVFPSCYVYMYHMYEYDTYVLCSYTELSAYDLLRMYCTCLHTPSPPLLALLPVAIYT